MANTEPIPLIRHLYQLAEQSAPLQSDRELLRAFACEHDEQAFATLVQRHAGLVYGVCRRVLRQPQDAEDAFQAVFLVLAKKAGSIGWSDTIGSWLYQTAWRVALKLRGDRCRQQQRLAHYAVEHPTPSDEPPTHELDAVLDEEMQRLPERYRQVLLLCYAQGKTQDEAAHELGWSVGALRGRLFRAKEMLRQRITRRCPSLATGIIAVWFTTLLQGKTPSAMLLRRTAEGGQRWATHHDVTNLLSSTAINLTQRTLHAMFIARIRMATLATLGLCVLGVGIVYRPVQADSPATITSKAKTEPTIIAPPNRWPQPEGVQGFITRINATATPPTLTVALEENRNVRIAFDVAKTADVRVSGQNAKLTDLAVGHEVVLRLADDDRTVATIDTTVKVLESELKKVDVTQRQLTLVTDDDDDDKPITETFTVGRDVPVYIDKYLDRFETLAECQKARVEFGTDGKTVVRIHGEWQRRTDLHVRIKSIDAAKNSMIVRVEVDDGDPYELSVNLPATAKYVVGGQAVGLAEIKAGSRAILRMQDRETLATLRMTPPKDKGDDDDD